MNRQQQDVIEYLQEENRILREKLGRRRILLAPAQTRRLATLAKRIGHKVLKERSALFEHLVADALGERGQAARLGGGEEDAPSAELFPQDAVLLLEILDNVLLLAVHSSGQRHEEEVEEG